MEVYVSCTVFVESTVFLVCSMEKSDHGSNLSASTLVLSSISQDFTTQRRALLEGCPARMSKFSYPSSQGKVKKCENTSIIVMVNCV